MNFAVHGREIKRKDIVYVQQIFDELDNGNFNYQVSASFASVLKDNHIIFNANSFFKDQNELLPADCVLSLGGDGTFLETLSYVGSKQFPILGVNFGRLGFLTAVQPQNISDTFLKLSNGNFTIDKRSLIRAKSETELFGKSIDFALNEIALSKTDSSSMIIVHAFVDNEFVNSYWADGLMVSTPTGSTGYNLSCGGPLIMPHADNLILTPICPHNLFVRPMIVSSDSTISLQVESRSNKCLISMDSRAKILNNITNEIIVTKETFKAHLVTLEGEDFLNTLRVKLGWGNDIRNKTKK